MLTLRSLTQPYLSHLLLLLLCASLLSACCDQEAIPKLKRDLYSSAAKTRNAAALELARCGDKADVAVPRLSELIYDKNVGVQSSAAYALRKIDTPAARSVLERAEARRRNRKKKR